MRRDRLRRRSLLRSRWRRSWLRTPAAAVHPPGKLRRAARWLFRRSAARQGSTPAARIDDGEENLQTEGAIAKYLASESGNAAAEASIQAFGGYGYTKEYLVEKIKRDVRITTIYEGTSEILEMTIARDRWQLHLKTRGEHYRQEAAALAPLAASSPECGADIAALALSSLAEVLESARIGRLTRNQHVLFKLGELIANAETARRSRVVPPGHSPGRSYEKTDRGFEPAAVAAMSRIFAREAALKVASEGVRLLRGTPGLAPGAPGAIAAEPASGPHRASTRRAHRRHGLRPHCALRTARQPPLTSRFPPVSATAVGNP